MSGLAGTSVWLVQSVSRELWLWLGAVCIALLSGATSLLVGIVYFRYRPDAVLEIVGRLGVGKRTAISWFLCIVKGVYFVHAEKGNENRIGAALDLELHSHFDKISCLYSLSVATDSHGARERQCSAIRHIITNREQFAALLGESEPMATLESILRSAATDPHVRNFTEKLCAQAGLL